MKKSELQRRIAKLARDHDVEWQLVGGTKHEKYLFNGVVIMIPRHAEIGEILARKILKDCENSVSDRGLGDNS